MVMACCLLSLFFFAFLGPVRSPRSRAWPSIPPLSEEWLVPTVLERISGTHTMSFSHVLPVMTRKG